MDGKVTLTQSSQQLEFVQSHLSEYKLLGQIGAGGMGAVFLAQDLRLQRKVAIKLLSLKSALGRDERLKEARALARLNHPNIVQIYQVMEFDEHIALVMEYLDGQNLYQVQQEQLLTLEQKLNLLLQVAQGLAAAHQLGVIHCDLKLSNVLLVDNKIKLVDFGLSELTHDNNQRIKANSSFGSQAYMSPEQLQQQPLNFASDLFSFGILAFQLLVGQHPFGHGTSGDIGKRIIKGQVMNANHVTPSLPPMLARLLNRLLAHKPAQRPQDGVEVAQCLEQVLITVSQEDILTQQTLPLEQIITESKAKPLYQRVGLVMSLICLLLTAFYYWSEWGAVQPRHVVVLRPEFIASEQMAKIQQDLVLGTIDDALRQSVLYGRDMNLISYREAKKFSFEIKRLAQATGATDIITTELDCNNQRCSVVFSRLGGANWSVIAQQRWPITVESFVNIFTSAQAQFGYLFDDYQATGLVQPKIEEQDYLRYIKLYHQVQFKRQTDKRTLLELEALLNRSPYLYAGYRLFREHARQLYSQDQDLEHLDRLLKLIEQAPPEYRYSVFAAIDRFWLAITKEQFSQAMQQLEIAQRRGINPSTLLEMQAYWHKVNNQLQLSIEYYQKALKLRPNTRLYYHLAVAYFWLSKMELAKQTLVQITQVIPNSYDANQLLGTIYLMEGDTEQAIQAYERFITDDARSIDLSNLGLAYTLQGEHNQALSYAIKAVAKSPMHPTWLLNLADAQSMVGMEQQALANYHKVLELNLGKQQVKAWLEMAQAYVHTDAKAAAVKALNQAKKLAPDSVEVSFTAALVYVKLNENISALAQIEEALNKDFGVVWFNLPWFDGLCGNQKFVQLMIAHNNQQRCHY